MTTSIKSKFVLGIAFDFEKKPFRLDLRRLTPSRFRIVDTYEGVVSDPISLHKYLYANANPVDNIDPSGHFSLSENLVAIGGSALIQGITGGAVSAAFAPQGHHLLAFADGFARGFISGAVATALLLASAGTALPVANAAGSFISNIIVDVFEVGALGTDKSLKQVLGNAIAQAAVAGLTASLWGKHTPDGREASTVLKQYSDAIRKAIKSKTPPTFPFETPAQTLEAFGKYAASKGAADKLFQDAIKRMASLMALDGTLSNVVSAIPSGLVDLVNGIGNWVSGAKGAANRRVYGE